MKCIRCGWRAADESEYCEPCQHIMTLPFPVRVVLDREMAEVEVAG